MDYQLFFNIASSCTVFLMGWFVRIAYDSATKMQQDITALERELHTHFVRREDYRADIREIKELLHSIQDRINNKVDK